MTSNNNELNTDTTIYQEEAHVAHVPTLYAEPIFHIGSFTITNALFTSWIVVVMITIISIVIRTSIKQIPRGIQNLFEFIIEGVEKLQIKHSL